MDTAACTPNIPCLIYSNKGAISEQLNMQNPSHHHLNHTSSNFSGDPSTTGKWAARLLRECAKAISDKDSSKIHQLLWMLNELASSYGDLDQKLASHFLQAFFCRVTDTGDRCYKTLLSVAEKNHSFECARKVMLKFQEVSPWTTFGHVASNGAILEALEGETKLHIIDISNTCCTQWPTLIEALATRTDDTPQLRITAVVTAGTGGSVIKEIGQRMEKFARLMRVPFEFHVVSGHLKELKEEKLKLRDGEAIAVNCSGALRRICVQERNGFVAMLKGLNPKVVTVIEEEADFTGGSRGEVHFVNCFEECLRFYSLFFEMLDESFVKTSNERLVLERECSRSIVGVLACDGDHGGIGDSERRERAKQWCGRLMESFSVSGFSNDVVDDVKALLKRYRVGWSLMPIEEDVPGLYLAWKEEAVVWASAWKPLKPSII